MLCAFSHVQKESFLDVSGSGPPHNKGHICSSFWFLWLMLHKQFIGLSLPLASSAIIRRWLDLTSLWARIAWVITAFDFSPFMLFSISRMSLVNTEQIHLTPQASLTYYSIRLQTPIVLQQDKWALSLTLYCFHPHLVGLPACLVFTQISPDLWIQCSVTVRVDLFGLFPSFHPFSLMHCQYNNSTYFYLHYLSLELGRCLCPNKLADCAPWKLINRYLQKEGKNAESEKKDVRRKQRLKDKQDKMRDEKKSFQISWSTAIVSNTVSWKKPHNVKNKYCSIFISFYIRNNGIFY